MNALNNVLGVPTPDLFDRMATDCQWAYYIRTRSGSSYLASNCGRVISFAGCHWIDFDDVSDSVFHPKGHWENLKRAPTTRKRMTLNVSEIESICEAADT